LCHKFILIFTVIKPKLVDWHPHRPKEAVIPDFSGVSLCRRFSRVPAAGGITAPLTSLTDHYLTYPDSTQVTYSRQSDILRHNGLICRECPVSC